MTKQLTEREYAQMLGKKGGQMLLKKRGREYFGQLAKLSHAAQKKKHEDTITDGKVRTKGTKV